MENSYRFFENESCRYFPCHDGLKEFNCLFCYCPLYNRKNCPGNPEYREINGQLLKICTACNFPHKPESYDVIVNLLRNPE